MCLRKGKLNSLLVTMVWWLLMIAFGQQAVVLGENTRGRSYDVDQGILGRVSEALNRVMIQPIEAIKIIKTMHRNKGFAPHGLHAGGREKVMSFLYSLIKSFETVQLYFGTEMGEYFTYFSYEGVYREPGNSGYRPDDPGFAKYYSICTDGNTGDLHNCTMTEGMEYIKCIDDCELVECDTPHNSCEGFTDDPEGCENVTALCPNYSIDTVQKGETLGYVPLSYHCIDEYGHFTQEPGAALNHAAGYTPDKRLQTFLRNGTCSHWDGSTVDRVIVDQFAACADGDACGDVYTGVIRTDEYDPRKRPWYIDTKRRQRSNWFSPYAFHTTEFSPLNIGFTYAEPYFETMDDGSLVFEGVFAVDYTLEAISDFLNENYGDTEDVIVQIFNAAAPYHLIGSSTGLSPYREVSSENPDTPCVEECQTVRVSATNAFFSSNHLDHVASLAAQKQTEAGFPEGESLVLQADAVPFSYTHVCESKRYAQVGTDLDWIIVATSPIQRNPDDKLVAGDGRFLVVTFIASLGTVLCAGLLWLWHQNRKQPAVKFGDYWFTSFFIIACVILNLTSFTLLGENTNFTCPFRIWSVNIIFVSSVAFLLVKVHRMYQLVGSRSLRRMKINNRTTLLRSFPFVVIEIAILSLTTGLDRPHPTEQVDVKSGTYSIRCTTESEYFWIIQLIYSGALTLVGCVLSYKCRKLDKRYRESNQLMFGMYNIAFTGLSFLILVLLSNEVSPATVHAFTAASILWGTTFTCAVFVFTRVFQPPVSSSIILSGVSTLSSPSRSARNFGGSLRGTIAAPRTTENASAPAEKATRDPESMKIKGSEELDVVEEAEATGTGTETEHQ